MARKIRMGMVGGSLDAFIGAVHRRAAIMDGEIELVCGAFSSSPEKSKATGAALYLPEDRVYGSFEEMIQKEKELPEGERMDFVSIVTPNHVHFAPAKMALENGFHVVCDKPVTHKTEDAEALVKIVEDSGLVFCLTHNYTGYPMVKEAKALIAAGVLGKVRKVIVEYPQGWLSTLVEATGQKQASWRTDPERSGAAGGLGDIGTHAENLAEYITGLRITEVCADLTIFVEGRKLDDDANVLLRFDNGNRGVITVSQVSAGRKNRMALEISGSKKTFSFNSESPNELWIGNRDGYNELLMRDPSLVHPEASSVISFPGGHNEGFPDTSKQMFKEVYAAIEAGSQPENPTFPTFADGYRELLICERILESARSEKWVEI